VRPPSASTSEEETFACCLVLPEWVDELDDERVVFGVDGILRGQWSLVRVPFSFVSFFHLTDSGLHRNAPPARGAPGRTAL
jgi:hypothetical protein